MAARKEGGGDAFPRGKAASGKGGRDEEARERDEEENEKGKCDDSAKRRQDTLGGAKRDEAENGQSAKERNGAENGQGTKERNGAENGQGAKKRGDAANARVEGNENALRQRGMAT